jgi:TetR/AcrR family transcriptional repressor of nem operon
MYFLLTEHGMKISKAQLSANRAQIVETAARLFRERGYNGVGVADIMKHAGFTHGGFYNHFASKEELIAAASARAFAELEERTEGLDIGAILGGYMSAEHRDDLATGCPAATLAGEAARQPADTQRVFGDGIEGWIARIEQALVRAGWTDAAPRRQKAINLLAKSVGAIVLARSVSVDNKLSDEILQACLDASLADPDLAAPRDGA